jgi:hypothetical protein
MSLKFFGREALVLACCVVAAALLVPVAYGQGRGRGHGGGGVIGIDNPGRGHNGGGGIIDEIGNGQGHGRGVRRGRWESPGTPRGPIVDITPRQRARIFRARHDNRNLYPGTPRRRRVRRGWYRHNRH